MNVYIPQNMKPGIGSLRAELLAELTEAEREKLEYRWKIAEETKYGPMPDVSTETGQTTWLSRIHSRLLAFYRSNGVIQPDSLRQLVNDVKDIIKARNCYEVDYTFDLAKIGLQLHREKKGRSIKELVEEIDMGAKAKQPTKELPKAAPGSLVGATKAEADDVFASLKMAMFNRFAEVRETLGMALADAKTCNQWVTELLKSHLLDSTDALVRNAWFTVDKAAAEYTEIVKRAKQAKADIAAAPKSDEPEKLNDWFPRDPGTPSPDEPPISFGTKTVYGGGNEAEPPLHWSKDDVIRSEFWGDCKTWFNKYDASRPMDGKEREIYTRKALGVEHIDQTTLTKAEAVAKVRETIDAEFKDKPAPETQNGNAQISNKNGGTLQEEKSLPVIPPVSENGTKKPEFEPSPILSEVKTLMGIPMSQLGKVLNRPHDDSYYSEIPAKRQGEKWTDIDPIAVRIRFDKVFGPQGFGWRIVPVQGIGKVNYELGTFKRKEGGDYTKHVVTLEGFALEYGIVHEGKITYVQTSAMSDSDSNDDRGYAYRGAYTSLMKQALKNFGGFDHFMDV